MISPKPAVPNLSPIVGSMTPQYDPIFFFDFHNSGPAIINGSTPLSDSTICSATMAG
jgi:hypothetical protein